MNQAMFLKGRMDMEENKKSNYRITFHDGPESNRSKDIDVYAESLNEAYNMAYKMQEGYEYILIDKIPTKTSIIGVEYEYYDKAAERNFTDRFFIKAENEQQAIDYYNTHYKGDHYGVFYGQSGKTERFIRGKVLKTYFSMAITFDADATVPEKDMRLNDKISLAKEQQNKQKNSPKNNFKCLDNERY